MLNKLLLSHSYLLYTFYCLYELDGEIFMAQQQKRDTRFYVSKDTGNLGKLYFLFFCFKYTDDVTMGKRYSQLCKGTNTWMNTECLSG